ncbi:MAG TPA: SRPBCC domain-containing protein [Bacteroidia bacterium]|nr:SRPBCC domain-containing protein [Bacteroidia bacterium]
MTHQPIIVEKIFNAPVSKVWNAITDRDEMKKWYFDLAEFTAKVGFKFQFTGGPSPERQYIHLCEITEVIPQKKLTYSWSYKGFKGISCVTFELLGEGNKTHLKLTHSGLESFPEENADFAKQNFIEGWNEIIHSSLKNYLEK